MGRFGTALGALFGIGWLVSLAPACSVTANIDDVYMSLDPDGARRRNVFFTDTKDIHCVVEAGVGREGVTIETLIRQLQRFDLDTGKTFDADRVVAQAESSPARSTGATKLDLALDATQLALFQSIPAVIPDDPANPPPASAKPPFPVGRFICESRLDGVLKGTATFNIQIPPCPTAQIQNNSACYGFYPEGQICPKFGLSSGEPATCTCGKQKGWACPQ